MLRGGRWSVSSRGVCGEGAATNFWFDFFFKGVIGYWFVVDHCICISGTGTVISSSKGEVILKYWKPKTMQSDPAGQGDGPPPPPEADHRDGDVERNNIMSDPAPCSLTLEDGSLMHLYESRLRRLRDYESTVLSPYNGREPQIDAPSSRRATSRRQLSGYESSSPLGVSPMIARQDPPSVIDVDGGTHASDAMDDITLSTGVNSHMETSSRLSCEKDGRAQVAPQGPEDAEDMVSEIDELEEDNLDPGAYISSHVSVHSSHASDEHDSSSEDLERAQERTKPETATRDTDGGNYSYSGSADSKYITYAVLVDRDNDDRAVEIALYSAARPHMRGFHIAWMGFFVAFFTWFAITPLLSEVAVSLTLDREEIWTSSILAVAGSAFTRVLIGPINDIYGARWTMSATLLFSAIPTAVAGLVIQNAASLYLIRLLIGVAGSAFVTCQFWSTSLFTAEVAGTANSLAAGWGNLGGGVAQVVMGSILFPLLKIAYGGEGYGTASHGYIDGEDVPYDRASDLAWRTAMLLPAVMCLYMAYACLRYSDDTPKGNFVERKANGLLEVETAQGAILRSCCKWNTWLLLIQYGCCFGVEITMTNAAALYFQEEFGQTTESAAAIASVFGWMNLFARGIGGFCSDMTSATHGMRGRLWCQLFLLAAEGGLVCLFSTTQSLASAIVVMVIFSIFVQAAEGSTFAIVPYVDCGVTGSVSGVIGAGGNVGGVIFSLLFRANDDRTAFLMMGILVMASSLITALISITGHRSLLRGEDSVDVLERRDIHVEQFGTIPNVEIHTNANDVNESVLRRPGPPIVSGAETIPT
jgi:NNP family nitrate/nitrite transporter-like MFS transporter